MWGTDETDAAHLTHYGKGRVISGKQVRDVLHEDGVVADFTWTRGDADTMLDYVHRVTDEADIYFVINRNNRPEDVDVRFRLSGRQPELWDPITRVRRAATTFRQEDHETVIPMRLTGEQSVFVIFRKAIAATASGIGKPNYPLYKPLQTVRGPWTVHFDPAQRGPKSVVFEELTDWTQRPEPDIRYYSGAASYQTTFTLPQHAASNAPGMVLDLGDVKNLAEVSLNGKNLGVVWMAPYQVDISTAVRIGPNYLEVKIVNLWPNRLIGDQNVSPSERRTRTNITKFKKDSPLLPSGLLGPVRVLVTEK